MVLKSQKELNKFLAQTNKNFIIEKLKEYYEITHDNRSTAKELAIFAFWEAKKQGRLDNLNRLSKINFTNLNKTL